MSPADYMPITEMPGLRISQEQLARFAHRYIHGAEFANSRRVLEVGCVAGIPLGTPATHGKAWAYFIAVWTVTV